MLDFLAEVSCDHIAGDPPEHFTLQTCPKCLGKGVIGDVFFNEKGHIETVNGISFLKQKIKKIIVENIRETGYGFNYDLLKTENDALKLSLRREITRCINYLIDLQDESEKEGYYYLPTEKLESISDIEIISSPDPRMINILIKCRTVSARNFEVNLTIEGK